MHSLRSPLLPLLLLALAHCGTPPVDLSDADAGARVDGSDVPSVDTLDVPVTDVPVTDVPAADTHDASVACPTSEEAAFRAGTPCPNEGTVCRYGYTRPECGGRTLRCETGTWREEHTDPMPACFLDGGAPTPFQCGSQTCDPSQFCIHPCSGVDPGPDSSVLTPRCGVPSDCGAGRTGTANGHDYVCMGCV